MAGLARVAASRQWAPATHLLARLRSSRHARTGFHQSLLESLTPSRGEGFDANGSFAVLKVLWVEIVEVADVADRHPFGVVLDELEPIAGADFAFLKDTEVEADPAATKKHLHKPRVSHLDSELEAGYAWLGNLHAGTADLEDVADVDLILEHPIDGEVLPELGMAEVLTMELLLPVLVVLDRVDVHGTIGPAVAFEIGLLISDQVELAEVDTALDGLLEDSRGRSAARSMAVTAEVSGPCVAPTEFLDGTN